MNARCIIRFFVAIILANTILGILALLLEPELLINSPNGQTALGVAIWVATIAIACLDHLLVRKKRNKSPGQS